MRKFSVLFLCLGLTSCASTNHLTDEGMQVRKISADWANQCQFLGADKLTNRKGASPEACKRRAFDEVRNSVAELGGNSYSVSNWSSNPCWMGGTTITYDAYKCPDEGSESSIKINLTDEDDRPKVEYDIYTKLIQLNELLEKGIITQEEFDIEKKRILDTE